eukprot:13844337-Alexandrium_andersonii.AAC.1
MPLVQYVVDFFAALLEASVQGFPDNAQRTLSRQLAIATDTEGTDGGDSGSDGSDSDFNGIHGGNDDAATSPSGDPFFSDYQRTEFGSSPEASLPSPDSPWNTISEVE